MNEIRLPEFFMPFPPAINPAVAETVEPMWAWLKAAGLVEHDAARRCVLGSRPEMLAARYYPTTDLSTLTVLAQWSAYGFLMDDLFDEGSAGEDPRRAQTEIDHLLVALDSAGPAHPNRVARVTADLWRRTAPGRSPGWCQFTLEGVRAWLKLFQAEARDRARGHALSFEEYRIHRRVSIAQFFVDFGEWAVGEDLPADLRLGTAWSMLREAASEHVGLFNDIVSAEKELAAGYPYNGVLIVKRDAKCSLQEAVDRVDAMTTGCVHRVLEAEQRLFEELDARGADDATRASVRKCVASIRSVVRGNFDWHFDVERYRSGVDPQNAMTPGLVDDLFGNSRTP